MLLAGLRACGRASGEAAKPRALAPVAAISPRSASQVIHAAYGDRAVTLRTALQVDAASLKLVGVTATGQRVFTASLGWKDGHRGTRRVRARPTSSPSGCSPTCSSRCGRWRRCRKRSEAGYDVSRAFRGRARVLKRAGRLIAEVHYAGDDPWSGRLWFVNFEHRLLAHRRHDHRG